MDNNYRVKYKSGNLEIEIESSDKDYVDTKLDELLAKEIHAETSSEKQEQEQKRSQSKKKAKKKVAVKSSASDSDDSIDITEIVSAINDSDEHEMIEENILNKSGQLPRIIMCLYFAQEVLDIPLTTGDIQTITDQLGIKIGSANAANTIKSNQKYFAGNAVRKKGAIVKYKLNRKGNEAYKKILDGVKR